MLISYIIHVQFYAEQVNERMILNAIYHNNIIQQSDLFSGFERAQTKRPQDTKEARAMALLLHREVLGMYPYCLDISHARAYARASADLLESSTSLKFPRFHDALNK